MHAQHMFYACCAHAWLWRVHVHAHGVRMCKACAPRAWRAYVHVRACTVHVRVSRRFRSSQCMWLTVHAHVHLQAVPLFTVHVLTLVLTLAPTLTPDDRFM